ncbi:MAG: DNA polymerase III subunit gamma/tau [Thermodesulfobacteriota bacterium]
MMSYQVFARKWRPQIFEEVVGQEHITETLKNALLSNRLAHAYLLSGTRGVGKTSVARIFAKALNCQDRQGGNPCNKCTACIEITNGSSVDVQEIDGASNRGIDEIRNLRENIRYLPSSGTFRIYIIDEVHMLTLPAFNALLKTLEEPPEHVKFIFATTEAHKVPVTILSRCQRFDFKRIPIVKIEEQIKTIVQKEGINISDASIAMISKKAEGSMRDAESLLDQVVSFAGNNVKNEQIIEILGIVDRTLIYKISKAIIDGNNKLCLEIVDEIYNYGYDIKAFYAEIIIQFRNLIVSLVSHTSHTLDLPDNELQEIKRQAKEAGLERLLQSLNFLIKREVDLRYTNNPRIALEAIFLKLAGLKDYISFDELLRKIEKIEKRLTTSNRIAYDTKPELAEIKKKYPAKKPVSDNDEKWSEFLQYITTKNKAMANILKKWKSYTLTADSLELPNGEGSFTGDYFNDSEHANTLITYAKEFFHPDFTVVFTKRGQAREKDEKKEGKEDRLPDTVHDILDIFEGSIVKES